MERYKNMSVAVIVGIFAVSAAIAFAAIYYLDLDDNISIGTDTTNGPDTLDANDSYGYTMANMGDLDGNGVDDLAVGAYADEGTSYSDSGVVYIHLFDNQGNILSTSRIDEDVEATIDSYDYYGWVVINMGDLDGNGVNDIAVGARSDEAGATLNTGAVYVHLLDYVAGSIGVLDTLLLGEGTAGVSGLDTGDAYAWSMANMGDLDGNGVNDIAVGAFFDEAGATNGAGAVYIHLLDYTTPNLSALSTLKIGEGTTGVSGLDAGDQYGRTLSNVGDLDGNGVNDIAVGALYDETGVTTSTGSVYIHRLQYVASTLSVLGTQKIGDTSSGLSNLESSDNYGFSIVSIDDLDGNGVSELAISAAAGQDSGNSDTGVVYVHFMNSDGSVASTVATNASEFELVTGDFFGWDIESISDVNRDGIADLLITANSSDRVVSGGGLAYVGLVSSTGIITNVGFLGHQGITLAASGRYGESVQFLGGFRRGFGVAVGAFRNAYGATATTGAVFLHIGTVRTSSRVESSQQGSRLRAMAAYKRWLDNNQAPVMGLPHVAIDNIMCPYFTGYARKGDRDTNTNGTVSRLQDFLTRQGYGLGIIDGIFGTKTHAAVSAWQNRYANEVLWPWRIVVGDTASLGYFYKTSRRAAHWQVGCPAESVVLENGMVLPELPSWR